MEYTEVDWLTVVVAAALNMIIGFFWYSQWLFGPTWLKLQKAKIEEYKPERSSILYGSAVSLIIAYFLARFEMELSITTVTDGMFVGFCVWLGFVATTQISSVIWGKTPFKLFVLDTGCKLLSFLVMSGVIGA